jgi:hypothetical protein
MPEKEQPSFMTFYLPTYIGFFIAGRCDFVLKTYLIKIRDKARKCFLI